MFSRKNIAGNWGCARAVRFGVAALTIALLSAAITQPAAATENRRADLEVTKSGTPDPVIAGLNLTYQLVVTNHGPDKAREVYLRDELPDEVEFVSAEAAGPETPRCWYDRGDHEVTCDLDDLEDDQHSTVTIVVHVPSDTVAYTECGTKIITNEARVWAHDGPHDHDDSNNIAAINTVVTEEADLRITKMSKPDDEILAGVPFRYTIFAENLGPSHARKVTIRDELLSNEDFQILDVILDPNQSDSGPYYEPNPEGGVTMEFDKEGPFEPIGIETKGRWVIQIEVVASETSDLNNLVTIFSHDKVCTPTPDPNTANNQALDEISIIDTCDLNIEKHGIGIVRNPETCGEVPVPHLTTAGLGIAYRLVVENRVPPIGEPGGSTATNVVVEDMLPVGVTVVLVGGTDQNGDPVTCNTGTPGDPLDPTTCNLGTLDPGATASMDIVVTVDSDYVILNDLLNTGAAVLHNNARVFSDKFDPDTSDNLALNTSAVLANADLSVRKGDIPDPVVAGESLTYISEVTNHGASDAENVGFIDYLSDDVDFVSATVLNGEGGEVCTYGAGAHTVICTLGNVPAGDTRLIHIETVVHSDAGSPLVNVVSVGSDTADCDETNNRFRQLTDVLAAADLEITKTANPDPVIAGTDLIYTLTVTNHGPSDAIGVLVNDTLPADVIYLDDDGDCLAAGNDVQCSLGDLAAGESKSVEIKVHVRPEAVCDETCGTKTITNHASTTSRTADPNDDNNTVWIETFVMDSADLKVFKASKPDDEIQAGVPFTYTIIVENLGPSYARRVTVRDDMFASGVFVPGAITSNRAYNLTMVPGPAGGVSFEATLTECLEPKNTLTEGRWIIQIEVTANEAQDINNLVQVFSAQDPNTGCPGTPDPDFSNNEAIDSISVYAAADLSIDKSVDLEIVEAGQQLVYTLFVENHGPSTATNVVISDVVPAGVTIDSVQSFSGNCVIGTPGDVLDPTECNVGTLAPGENATVIITVTVDYDLLPQQICNNARVDSDTYDPDTSNNLDYACSHVILPDEADIEVIKTASPDPVLAGEHLIYSITVRNNGPNVAVGVVMEDSLPDDVTFIEADFSGCTLDLNRGGGELVDCALGNLNPGEETTIRLKVHVRADAVSQTEYGTDTIYNVACAESETFDPNEENNCDQIGTFVMESADLTVIKMSKPDDQILAGEIFEYTIIVENLGPTEARAVQIVDDMISSEGIQIVEIIEDENRADSCYIDDSDPTFQVMRCELFNPLEPVGVEGDGRWVIQVRATAAETQDVNNIVRVFTGVFGHESAGFTWLSGTPDPDPSNNQATDSISIVDTSDLSLTKSAEGQWYHGDGCGFATLADLATAGAQLTYTLDVTNNAPAAEGEPGGSTATNVVIKDYLPYGVEVVSVTGSGPGGPAGCNPGTPGDPAAPTTCNVGTLAVGESGSMTIVVLVRPEFVIASASDLLQNGARAFSDNVDPDESDNLASNTTAVNAIADLEVQKDNVPSEVVAGDSLTYALLVLNNGPSSAEQAALLDQLPAAVSFVSAEVLGGNGTETCTYAEGAHSVACTFGDIGPGDVRIVHIEVQVDPDAPASITNIATVGALTPDCDHGNNTDTSTAEVSHEADLSVTKSGDPDPVHAGDLLIYTLTVTNHGPSAASDVNVVDTLPADVAYVDDDSSCAAFGNTVTCDLGDLAVGASRSVNILVQVAADAVEDTELGGKTITNTVVTDSSTTDPNETNNTHNEETFVTDSSDLAVTKLSVPDPDVNAGEEFRYTIFVENLGPSSARGVNITDDLLSSGDFTLVEIVEDPDRDDTCLSLRAMEETIQCTLNEPLEPVGVGGTGRWKIQIVVTANEPQDVQNIVRAYTEANSDDDEGNGPVVGLGGGFTWLNGTPDPNTANNQAIAFVSVNAVSDLAIVKTDNAPQGASAGDDVTYTLTVTNNGPSTAVNVVVEDFLPADVQLVSITPSQGMCSGGTPGNPADPATCNLGDIASGDMETVTLVVRLDDDIDSVLLINNAEVSSDNFDDDNSNNIDHTIIPVNGAEYADLAIFKTGKPDRVVDAGEELTYTIMVDNLGPDPAQNVVIDEVIISDGMFELVSVTSDRLAACDPNSGVFNQRLELTCELGGALEPIDTDGNGRWTVTVVVIATEGVSINNDAFVHSNTPDPNLSNNRALTTHDVQELVNLAIDKSDSPDPVGIGHELTYLLTVTNNGPSTGKNVVVEDVLPVRLAPVEVIPSQGACTIGTPGDPTDPLRCNLGTLNVGASATVTIVSLVVGGECDESPIANNAKTYSDHPDPDNSDNIVSIFTQVVDGEPPIIDCPDPITVTSQQGGGLPNTTPAIAAFLAGATAEDNCDPDVDITHDGPAVFPIGPTEVTFTATDDDGNSASCTSTVTVVSPAAQTQPADDDPPSPAQQVVDAITGGSAGGICGVSMTQSLAMCVFGLLAFSLHARTRRDRR